MPLLEVKDLQVEFRTHDAGVRAVNGVNFTLEEGATLGIVGESGSGKSQSILAMMGLLASNGRASGQALYRGENLIGMSHRTMNRIRGNRLSILRPHRRVFRQRVRPCFLIHHRVGGFDRDCAENCFEHLRAIHSHVKPRIVDYVLANRQKVSPVVARRYRQEGAAPVRIDIAGLRRMGVKVLLGNLLDEHDKIRHNSERLARLLLDEFLPRASRK